MSLKEIICQRLSEKDYAPLTVPELIVQLELDGFDAYHAEKAIRTLEREHRLTVTKKGKVLPVSASPIRQATLRATQRGFCFADVLEENGQTVTYFVSSRDRQYAIHGDTVLIRILSLPKQEKEGEAKVEQVLSHAQAELIGTVEKKKFYNKKRKPVWVLSPDDRRFGSEIEIDLHGSLPFHERDKVLLTVTAYPGPFCGLRGKVSRVFGKSSSLRATYESILYQNGIPRHFPKETLADADTVSERAIEAGKRLDLRNGHPYGVIFTIDGEDAKDLDDAISLCKTERGSYLLGVHIADVSEYVRPNTPCDREAMERGCSVYFVDQVVPMLPASLSNGSCSLHPGVDRYALSALMELDSNGELLSFSLKESILRTQIRGVYTEVNDVIAHGEASPYAQKYAALLPDTLGLLCELYGVLERKSQRRGMLDLETVEAVFALDEQGYPIDVLRRERGIAERMIEQFMLCANEAVAVFCHTHSIPCVYRVHEEPSEEKLQAFALFASQNGLDLHGLQSDKPSPQALRAILMQAKEKGIEESISMALLRSLAKARYAPSPALHFGLGIEYYCHFTSPIRRYPDLSVHRILKAYLHNGLSDKERARFHAFTQKSALQSTDGELRALCAEREITELYQILFLQPQLGKCFDGTVTGLTDFGMFVRLDNTCEGLIPLHSLEEYAVFNESTCTLQLGKRVYHLADRVRVRLIEADTDTRRITLQLLLKEARKEKQS